jgi:hypothetical protein
MNACQTVSIQAKASGQARERQRRQKKSCDAVKRRKYNRAG